jgi:hypothetical protein
MFGALIAAIDRAGDHAAVFGLLVLVAGVAGLIYGLVHLAGKRRADRAQSDQGPERAGGRDT